MAGGNYVPEFGHLNFYAMNLIVENISMNICQIHILSHCCASKLSLSLSHTGHHSDLWCFIWLQRNQEILWGLQPYLKRLKRRESGESRETSCRGKDHVLEALWVGAEAALVPMIKLGKNPEHWRRWILWGHVINFPSRHKNDLH